MDIYVSVVVVSVHRTCICTRVYMCACSYFNENFFDYYENSLHTLSSLSLPLSHMRKTLIHTYCKETDDYFNIYIYMYTYLLADSVSGDKEVEDTEVGGGVTLFNRLAGICLQYVQGSKYVVCMSNTSIHTTQDKICCVYVHTHNTSIHTTQVHTHNTRQKYVVIC
jgi:hypothetical protein